MVLRLEVRSVLLVILAISLSSAGENYDLGASKAQTSSAGLDNPNKASASGCTGWSWESSCYHFVTEQQYDFYSAEAHCALQHNGHLAAPRSTQENGFLKMKLIEHYAG